MSNGFGAEWRRTKTDGASGGDTVAVAVAVAVAVVAAASGLRVQLNEPLWANLDALVDRESEPESFFASSSSSPPSAPPPELRLAEPAPTLAPAPLPSPSSRTGVAGCTHGDENTGASSSHTSHSPQNSSGGTRSGTARPGAGAAAAAVAAAAGGVAEGDGDGGKVVPASSTWPPPPPPPLTAEKLCCCCCCAAPKTVPDCIAAAISRPNDDLRTPNESDGLLPGDRNEPGSLATSGGDIGRTGGDTGGDTPLSSTHSMSPALSRLRSDASGLRNGFALFLAAARSCACGACSGSVGSGSDLAAPNDDLRAPPASGERSGDVARCVGDRGGRPFGERGGATSAVAAAAAAATADVAPPRSPNGRPPRSPTHRATSPLRSPLAGGARRSSFGAAKSLPLPTDPLHAPQAQLLAAARNNANPFLKPEASDRNLLSAGDIEWVLESGVSPPVSPPVRPMSPPLVASEPGSFRSPGSNPSDSFGVRKSSFGREMAAAMQSGTVFGAAQQQQQQSFSAVSGGGGGGGHVDEAGTTLPPSPSPSATPPAAAATAAAAAPAPGRAVPDLVPPELFCGECDVCDDDAPVFSSPCVQPATPVRDDGDGSGAGASVGAGSASRSSGGGADGGDDDEDAKNDSGSLSLSTSASRFAQRGSFSCTRRPEAAATTATATATATATVSPPLAPSVFVRRHSAPNPFDMPTQRTPELQVEEASDAEDEEEGRIVEKERAVKCLVEASSPGPLDEEELEGGALLSEVDNSSFVL
eukprot:Rhum_TRINITY_DN14121_c28_g1::Rhum_TRINITY_DN14121_c28_g1_i1::g.71464::m.71464